jgi:hypothetical protein
LLQNRVCEIHAIAARLASPLNRPKSQHEFIHGGSLADFFTRLVHSLNKVNRFTATDPGRPEFFFCPFMAGSLAEKRAPQV